MSSIIFNKGLVLLEPNHFYFVESGNLQLKSSGFNKRFDFIIDTFSLGDCLPTPHRFESFYLFAETEVRCKKISFEALNKSIGPDFCGKMVKMQEKLQEIRIQYSESLRLNAKDRMASILLSMAESHRSVAHPEGKMIKTTRQHLAALCGCSREVAGRILKDLEIEGFLKARGKTIVFLGEY